MSFKDSMKEDLKIFLNCGEFAEKHNIRYDGKLYEDVSCVLTHINESERATNMSDHGQGIYVASTKVHFDISDLNGNLPEQGAVIAISDEGFMRRYYVASSHIAEGMAKLELEAFDE